MAANMAVWVACLAVLVGALLLASSSLFSLRGPVDFDAELWSANMVAHRCGMAYAPQNTLAALEVAHSQEIKAVEIDVQLTDDGKVVVFHDAILDGLTDCKGTLNEMSFQDVRKCHVTAQATTKDQTLSNTPRPIKIPTLEEIFAFALPRNMSVIVEVKELRQKKRIASEVALIFEQFSSLGSYRKAVVGSFDPFTLAAFKSVQARINTLWFSLPGGAAEVCQKQSEHNHASETRGGTTVKLLPWGVCLVAPLFDYVLQAMHFPLVSYLGVAITGPQWQHVSHQYIRRMKERGVLTNVWTVNDAASKRAFRQWGAIVTTDCASSMDSDCTE